MKPIQQPASIPALFKFFLVLALVLISSACSTMSTSTQSPSSPKVEINPDVFITLPTPEQLGYSVTASQLITASWPSDDKSTNTQQTLPVHLEVSNDHLVLAGFSSWGTRILSLTYQNENIETSVLTGLEGSLPEPEQILFNLMITLWPLKAWEGPLNQVEWRISEEEKSRTIFDKNGDTVIHIEYQPSAPLSGLIQFTHQQLGYSISIQTLDVDIKDPTTNDQ